MSLEEAELPPPPSVYRKILGGGAWGVGGHATALLLGLASNAIVTRLLDPRDAGTYFLVMSLTNVGVVVATAGLPVTMMRLIAESMARGEEGRARETVRRGLRLGLISAAAGSILFLIPATGDLLGRLFPATRIGAVAGFIGLLLAARSLGAQRGQAFRGFQMYGHSTVIYLVMGPAFTVLFLALLLSSGRAVTLTTVIAAATIGLVPGVLLGSALLRMRTRSLSGPGTVSYAQIRRVALPLLVSSLANLLTIQAHFWIVSARLEAADVAHYGAAIRLANLLTISLFVSSSVVAPLATELHTLDRVQQMERMMRGTATLAFAPALAIGLALIVAGPRILSLVFGSFYTDAAPVLIILVVGNFFLVGTGHSETTLTMTGRERWTMAGVLLGLFCSLVVSFATVGTLGVIGPALGATTGHAVKNLFTWIAARRLVGVWTHAGITPIFWEVDRLKRLLRERRR